MSIRRFHIKRNDTRPPLQVQIFNPDGSERDLTGATVKFLMKAQGAVNAKVNAAVTNVDILQGIVEYRWVAADTDTAGEYRGEFQISEAGGIVETFPHDGYLVVEVLEDLGT